jgi:hypothetical protein
MLEFAIWMYTSFPGIFGMVSYIVLPEWFFGVFFITLMLAFVVYIVAGSIRGRLEHLLRVFQKVGVVVGTRCEACSRDGERTWTKGDFVFKEEGECACGGSTYISKMFLMPLPLKKKE